MIERLYETTPYLKAVIKQTGYETLESLMFLYWVVKAIHPDCVLEMGTGYGCSTIFMALALDKGKVYSVDDYRGDATSDIEEVNQNLRACKVADKIELMKQNTKDNYPAHISPEIVFMDASHNDIDLQLDYAALKSVLPKDHIIIVDDVFSVDVDVFVARLSREYNACFVLKFHNGMAVLNTNIDKYLLKITDSIRRTYL